MKWQQILQNDAGRREPLLPRIEALFAEQRGSWPALREGEAALERLQKNRLEHDGDWIVVQLNPGRQRSTQAKTDAQAIASRPCFLCPQNMPLEERGVAFEELVVLPNPFPVLPLHCTIADREHRPQQIAGRLGTMLRVAEAVGPTLAVFYNGPRCGASAPDHFHFQAASAPHLPILGQLSAVDDSGDVLVHTNFGRPMLIVAHKDADAMEAAIAKAFVALHRLQPDEPEPMFNLLVHHDGTRWIAVVFPRRMHRPARYFAEGPERLAVSPAVLEMAGILVTTEATDFDCIDAAVARSVYEEVSWGIDQICKAIH
jgi:hypothetical protein